METSDVTFDETMPCPSSVFEPAGDAEMENTIFEEDEDDDWGNPEQTPPAAPIASTSTMMTVHSPDPSTSTTWGPVEQHPQPAPVEAPGRVPTTAVEGEASSERQAPCHI